MQSSWPPTSPISRKAKRPALAACLAASLLLAACTPPEKQDPDPTPGTISKVGFVLLTESHLGEAHQVSGQASFTSAAQPLAAKLLEKPFGPLGSCTVTRAAPAVIAPVAPTDDGATLNVGDRFTLLSGSEEFGAWLLASGRYDFQGAAGALPAEGLSLYLPANGNFPAFEALPVVTGAPLAFDAGFDPTAVTESSEFAWEGGSADASAVLLVGASGPVTFSCVVPDSGTFSFPAMTAAALRNADFGTGALVSAGRLTLAQHQKDDASLIIATLRLSGAAPIGTAR